ncbi:MAG: hypothetical protein M1818_008408 [Claussenomyces sp. TS43310]|nr:MAG: hypothetical protein M1818_008408 [Claussenomyces sp. TS43310]
MYSSMSVTTVVVSVVLPFLAVAAVGLRLVAQHRNPKRFTADEMVVVLNCVILIGSGCLLIVGACVGGIGADLRHVSPGTVVSFRKIAFVSEFFYITTVRLVKVSLLLYYRRIFVLPAFRRVSNAVLGLVAVWMLAFIITTIVQARPISWNWTEKGQHVDLHSFFISEAVTNIALDVLLLCMPSFVVKGLHMSFKKKFAVVSILALGSL